jgi:hypothetical protein
MRGMSGCPRPEGRETIDDEMKNIIAHYADSIVTLVFMRKR